MGDDEGPVRHLNRTVKSNQAHVVALNEGKGFDSSRRENAADGDILGRHRSHGGEDETFAHVVTVALKTIDGDVRGCIDDSETNAFCSAIFDVDWAPGEIVRGSGAEVLIK